jgi:hypothetical protein
MPLDMGFQTLLFEWSLWKRALWGRNNPASQRKTGL